MDFLSAEELKESLFQTGLKELKKWGKGLLTLLAPPTTAQAVGSSIVKSKALDTVEDVLMGRGLKFKYYGNWAGPNYSAGRFYDKNEIITKEDIQKAPPIDDLDALTLKHDLRYQFAATRNTQEERKKALRQADEQFIREANQLLNSKDLGLKQRAATIAAVKAFQAKLAFDVGYNIDRLPEDKIEEAKKVSLGYFNQVDPDDLGKIKDIENNTNLVFQGDLDDDISNFDDAEEKEKTLNSESTKVEKSKVNKAPSAPGYQLTDDDRKLIIEFLEEIFDEI